MIREPMISVVLPVRNVEATLVAEVERLLEMLSDLTTHPTEILLVDDASSDASGEVAAGLSVQYPQVRSMQLKHQIGYVEAGQIGLEKSDGEYVFIQESSESIQVEDLQKLWQMRADDSLVAARAQRSNQPKAPLLRRLRGWGQAATRVDMQHPETSPSPDGGLHMIKKQNLQWLGTEAGQSAELETEQFNAEDKDL